MRGPLWTYHNNLAKVGVEGSNPFARSSFPPCTYLFRCKFSEYGQLGCPDRSAGPNYGREGVGIGIDRTMRKRC